MLDFLVTVLTDSVVHGMATEVARKKITSFSTMKVLPLHTFYYIKEKFLKILLLVSNVDVCP
jgi:hypothetical protein